MSHLIVRPSPVRPLHLVRSWCLRALPRDPSPSYLFHPWSPVLYTVTAVVSSGYVAPQNDPTMGHGGPLVPVSPRKVAVLSEPYFGIARVSLPLSWDVEE